MVENEAITMASLLYVKKKKKKGKQQIKVVSKLKLCIHIQIYTHGN
jgi:hypothetical protein